MKKNLLYSTMKWEMQRKDIKKNIDKNSSYITQGLHFILGNLNNDKSDIIYEYNSLAFEYYNIANKSYFATEDVEAFKGYYYLSAKAIEMCFILYEKGLRSRFDRENNDIESNLAGRAQADCALLAGEVELALHLATRNSVIGNLILRDYGAAKKYIDVEKENDKNFKEMLLSIIEGSDKNLEAGLRNRIVTIRKEARYEFTDIDRFGLTILKLAKMRGMSCDIHVAELPLILLEDTPIDKTKWVLPVPERVQVILEQ